MSTREYGVNNGDGTTTVWGTDDAGNYWPIRTESTAQNQGQGSSGGDFNWPGLWGSVTGSNQAYLDAQISMNNARVNAQLATSAAQVAEAKYEFDTAFNNLSAAQKEQFGEMKREFDSTLAEKQREFGISTWSDLAQSLLQGAVSLRGPQDWLSYAQYTNGGKDIFKQLYGDQPAPAFGAPTGNSPAANITDILKALGVTQMPAMPTGTPTTTTPQEPMYDTQNGKKTLAQMRQELVAASGGMQQWRDAPDAQVISEYGKITGKTVTPVAAATTPQPGDVMHAMGTQSTQQTSTAGQGDRMYGGPYNTGQPQSSTPPVSGYQPSAPLPHQINPAVWDSLSSTAQEMILAAAKKGYTPSGAWSAQDYMNQMNAARPKGTAPRQTNYNWGSMGSYF